MQLRDARSGYELDGTHILSSAFAATLPRHDLSFPHPLQFVASLVVRRRPRPRRPAQAHSRRHQPPPATPPTLEAQFAALPPAWRAHLKPFIESDAYAPLCRFVDGERAAGKTVYPADVFRALRLTSPDEVKVVILGQDPYHGEDRGTPQAHGLAFSVAPNVRTPPSLRNIFKEIAASLGHEPPRHGCLDTWAKQGVLLLNTVLTVERDSAASHAKRGWEKCTDTLIHELAMRTMASCSCCGARMRKPNARCLAASRITCWKRRIPRRCRRIAAFSAAGILRRPTTIS